MIKIVTRTILTPNLSLRYPVIEKFQNQSLIYMASNRQQAKHDFVRFTLLFKQKERKLNERMVLEQNQSFVKFPIGGVQIVCHLTSPLVTENYV